MKSKTAFITLLGLLWSIAAMAQTDSLNHIHTMKSHGPASIQILWLDRDTKAGFMERSIRLQAALQCGTEKYKSSEFRRICTDYRINWEIESANGIHRVGLTFSHLKKDLAFELLNEVLNHTAYATKEWNAWREKELYHYGYYRYDSDSLLKWWMNGKRDFYEALQARTELEKEITLMEALGKPVIVSTIGNTAASYFEKQLGDFISTSEEVHKLKGQEEIEQTLIGTSSKGCMGQYIKGGNPLEVYTLHAQIIRQNEAVVNLSGFSWSTATAWISFDKNATIHKEEVLKGLDNTLSYSREALLVFDLWLEFNKNQALTKAYESLQIWQEPVVHSKEDQHNTIVWYQLLPKS